MTPDAVRLPAFALVVVLVVSVSGGGGYYTAGLLFDTQQAAGNFSVVTPENTSDDTNETPSSLVSLPSGSAVSPVVDSVKRVATDKALLPRALSPQPVAQSVLHLSGKSAATVSRSLDVRAAVRSQATPLIEWEVP